MIQSQQIIAIYHLLGIYRKSTYKLVRWTPKSCLNRNPNFQHLLNGLLQWMAKLRNVSGSWNSSWAGVLLHFRAACCTKPYKSGPNPEREFKMILQVMKLWWSTPTSERTISFLFFSWEGPKNGVAWESYAQQKKNHCLSTSCSDGEKGWQKLPYFAVKRDQDWEEKSSPQPREKKEEKKEPSDITQFGLPDDQFELSTKLDAGGQGTVFRCEA